MNHFRQYLNQDMVQFVISQVIHVNVEDKPSWRHTASGEFTTRSAYFSQANIEKSRGRWGWKHVWKLKIPQRSRMFMWKACKESLLTNEARVHRGLAESAVCGCCEGVVEDVLHVLKDCSLVVEVWMMLLPSTYCYTFFSHSEVKIWMKWNIGANFIVRGFSWPTMFALLCHQLWLARNHRIFNEGVVTSQTLVAKVLACIAWGGERVSHAITRNGCDDRWKAPVKGFVKLNVDGSCFPSSHAAACAGILRDHRGDVKGGFLFNIGRGECYMAERWAILMGFKWSWDFGVRHLVIESDCLELVQEIEKSRYGDNLAQSEMKEIISFFHREWELKIVWCKRDANGVADYLAKHALTVGRGLVSFENVPAELQLIVDMLSQERELLQA